MKTNPTLTMDDIRELWEVSMEYESEEEDVEGDEPEKESEDPWDKVEMSTFE